MKRIERNRLNFGQKKQKPHIEQSNAINMIKSRTGKLRKESAKTHEVTWNLTGGTLDQTASSGIVGFLLFIPWLPPRPNTPTTRHYYQAQREKENQEQEKEEEEDGKWRTNPKMRVCQRLTQKGVNRICTFVKASLVHITLTSHVLWWVMSIPIHPHSLYSRFLDFLLLGEGN